VSDVSDVSTNSCDFWLQTAGSFGGQNLDSPGLRLAPCCCRNHPGWWNQPEARPRQMKHMKPWSDARIISYKRILYVPQCVSRMQRACPMRTSPATIATMQMGLRVRSWSRVKQKEPGPIWAWLYNIKWFKCVHWFETWSSISWINQYHLNYLDHLSLENWISSSPSSPSSPNSPSVIAIRTFRPRVRPRVRARVPAPDRVRRGRKVKAGVVSPLDIHRLDREMNGIGWPFINHHQSIS